MGALIQNSIDEAARAYSSQITDARKIGGLPTNPFQTIKNSISRYGGDYLNGFVDLMQRAKPVSKPSAVGVASAGFIGAINAPPSKWSQTAKDWEKPAQENTKLLSDDMRAFGGGTGILILLAVVLFAMSRR